MKDIGRSGLIFRGEYDPARQYEMLDMVYADGGCYICISSDPITGIPPTDHPERWGIAARSASLIDRQAAEAAAAAAAQDRTLAQQAKADAEAAKGTAVSARDAAVSAKDTAVTKAGEASASAGAAAESAQQAQQAAASVDGEALMAAVEATHDASNITSGTLPPERGGTGKGTLKDAFAALSFREATADCNAAISNGRYRWGPDTLNRPPDAYGVINTFTNTADDYNGNTNSLYQIGYSTGGNVYYRHKINNSAWIPWKQYVLNGDSPTFYNISFVNQMLANSLTTSNKEILTTWHGYAYFGNTEVISVLRSSDSALLQRPAGIATVVDTGNLHIIRDWIRDTFFPVGKIWISTNSTSPASIIGGTWAPVETGRFLVSAGIGYGVGSTGGATTHLHGLGAGWAKIVFGAASNDYNSISMGEELKAVSWTSSFETNAAAKPWNRNIGRSHAPALGGTTDSVNGLPPWYAVYMWRRTA